MIIDISKWQVGIDLQAAKDDGVTGVIIKATQGFADSGHDPLFLYFVGECHRIGLPWGAYHYYLNGYDPVLQAASLRLRVQLAEALYGPAQLGLWADFEDTEPLSDWLPEDMFDFCGTVNQTHPIGIYTGAWWMGIVKQHYGISRWAWMADYKLWLAHYDPDPPNPIYPWSSVYLWQQGQFLDVWNVSAVDANWVM